MAVAVKAALAVVIKKTEQCKLIQGCLPQPFVEQKSIYVGNKTISTHTGGLLTYY